MTPPQTSDAHFDLAAGLGPNNHATTPELAPVQVNSNMQQPGSASDKPALFHIFRPKSERKVGVWDGLCALVHGASERGGWGRGAHQPVLHAHAHIDAPQHSTHTLHCTHTQTRTHTHTHHTFLCADVLCVASSDAVCAGARPVLWLQLLLFVRHGESEYNRAVQEARAYSDPMIFDPRLTQKGLNQVSMNVRVTVCVCVCGGRC